MAKSRSQIDPLLAAERKRRFRLLASVIPAILGFLLILGVSTLDPELLQFRWGIMPEAVFLVGAVSVLAGATSAILSYLETGFKRENEEDIAKRIRADIDATRAAETEIKSTRDRVALERIRSDVDKLKADYESLGRLHEGELTLAVLEQIKSSSAEELLRDLENRLSPALEAQFGYQAANEAFSDNVRRLFSEIMRLGRRGNINLAFGVGTTIAGIGLLFFFVLFDESVPADPMGFGLHFVPRLALVIFVQTFAYFFLRLYKSSLKEIQFFQNELTNVEQRQIALLAAKQLGDNEAIKGVISVISLTDRNAAALSAHSEGLSTENSDKQNLFELAKQAVSALGNRAT